MDDRPAVVEQPHLHRLARWRVSVANRPPRNARHDLETSPSGRPFKEPVEIDRSPAVRRPDLNRVSTADHSWRRAFRVEEFESAFHPEGHVSSKAASSFGARCSCCWRSVRRKARSIGPMSPTKRLIASVAGRAAILAITDARPVIETPLELASEEAGIEDEAVAVWMVTTCFRRISSGSCSTHPGFRKCWVNSD